MRPIDCLAYRRVGVDRPRIALLNTLFKSYSCVPLGGELFNATRSIAGNIYTFALAGTNSGGVEGGIPGRFLSTLDQL